MRARAATPKSRHSLQGEGLGVGPVVKVQAGRRRIGRDAGSGSARAGEAVSRLRSRSSRTPLARVRVPQRQIQSGRPSSPRLVREWNARAWSYPSSPVLDLLWFRFEWQFAGRRRHRHDARPPDDVGSSGVTQLEFNQLDRRDSHHRRAYSAQRDRGRARTVREVIAQVQAPVTSKSSDMSINGRASPRTIMNRATTSVSRSACFPGGPRHPLGSRRR